MMDIRELDLRVTQLLEDHAEKLGDSVLRDARNELHGGEHGLVIGRLLNEVQMGKLIVTAEQGQEIKRLAREAGIEI